MRMLSRLKKPVRILSPFIAMLLSIFIAGAQNKTDSSLFLKKDKSNYLTELESKSGNMFHKVGHHGPAIENQWLGFRIYFDKKTAIDIYSKEKSGLELRDKKWYPSKKEQLAGWGADYYKVGKSVGLGGIKLWDGEKIIPLNPVSKRSAKVKTEGSISFMELLSEGVKYKDKTVDILIRVTVFSDKREAKVEAFSMTGESVQFATGINYFDKLKIETQQNFIATWGVHPEDVAAEKVEIGAAIIFNPDDFEKQINDGNQYLLISNPSTKLETRITSANAREAEINSFEKFMEIVQSIE